MPVRLKKKNIILVAVVVLFVLLICVKINALKGSTSNRVLENVREFSSSVTTVDSVDMSDPFWSQLIREKKITNKAGTSICVEKRNYAFIKTMKCATQTLVQMFRRFGYRRHLNFVLPRQNRIYLGWPFILESQDFRASSKPFNALVDHSVYNETAFEKVMPNDTLYFTVIREPWSHFKSSFNYFNVANISKVPDGPDRMTDYLNNIEKYDQFYRSEEASSTRFCIPNGFSVTKNLMSHCLGMPLGFPSGRENITSDAQKVKEYIEFVDKKFALVMMMEYFHESLVLLKRLMCWSLEDILYHTSNVGDYSSKFRKPDPKNHAIFKQWSHVDFTLYDHFNHTFWSKVRDQGDDFFPEVAVYNSLHLRVTNFCSSEEFKTASMTIKATDYHREIVVDKDYCLLLGIDLMMMLKIRTDYQEDYNANDAIPVQNKRGC